MDSVRENDSGRKRKIKGNYYFRMLKGGQVPITCKVKDPLNSQPLLLKS